MGRFEPWPAGTTNFARIARVVKHIHAEHARPLGVEEMARRAGMSVPVFHHHFKLVTASSPLQYLKRIRLDRAPGLQRQSTAEAISSGLPARPRGTFLAIAPYASSFLATTARGDPRVDPARIDHVHADAVLDVLPGPPSTGGGGCDRIRRTPEGNPLAGRFSSR